LATIAIGLIGTWQVLGEKPSAYLKSQ